MKVMLRILTNLFAIVSLASCASASVYLPSTAQSIANPRAFATPSFRKIRNMESREHRDFHALLRRYRRSRAGNAATAMAIPGYGVTEQIFVGGFANFLSIYNLIITARILLSWFPQAQGVGALQPIYAITDPFLNLFRGVIPPLFGLDFSPILAFFLLNVLSNATAAVGYDLPPEKLRELRHRGYQGTMNSSGSTAGTSTVPSRMWSRNVWKRSSQADRTTHTGVVSLNL